MEAPLRWTDGMLELLDQTLLPAQEHWLRCERAEDVAAAIERLAIRGAPAIGIAAAYGLALGLAGKGVGDGDDRDRVIRVRALLAETRPTAVNLAAALERGADAALRALERGADPAAAALEEARAIEREELESERLIAQAGAELLPDGTRALTHCNAGGLATAGVGTAGGVIAAAHAAGRIAEVIACETRPLLQGARLTAWELDRAGIPFRLATDSSAGTLMARGLVDAVIVGADRIARNGDTANKVGTYPLAVLADRHDLPFYVAAPRSTIDPALASGAEIPIEERDPGEVTSVLGFQVAPAGTRAANYAFDVTPAELVSAIITEAGVLEPPFEGSIEQALAR